MLLSMYMFDYFCMSLVGATRGGLPKIKVLMIDINEAQYLKKSSVARHRSCTTVAWFMHKFRKSLVWHGDPSLQATVMRYLLYYLFASLCPPSKDGFGET